MTSITIREAQAIAVRFNKPEPRDSTLRLLCNRGLLIAEKRGIWHIDLNSYLTWLEGYPHKTGPKG